MIVFCTFIIALGVLLLEGCLIAGLCLPSRDRWLRLSIALPLAAISNVLLFFVYTIVHIPLTPITLGAGHGLMIGMIFFIQKRVTLPARPKLTSEGGRDPIVMVRDSSSTLPFHKVGLDLTMTRSDRHEGSTRGSHLRVTRLIRLLCTLLLANIAIFSFSHAMLLHTFSIDSLTNWTMRSKISFIDQRMAFDPTEERGMAKPQYPFLIHALQIAVNEGNRDWSDRAANAATWLLSLSAFSAVFLMLKKLRGTDTALIALTASLSIPLLSIHLAQGYGDVHLVEYLLLGMTTLAIFIEQKIPHAQRVTMSLSWFDKLTMTWRRINSGVLLSSIFLLGALWTKSEGMVFGFLPWMIVIGALAAGGKLPRNRIILPLLLPILLFAPFLIFLLAKGLPLTPHGTDMSFRFHSEAVPALWTSLLSSGAFGIVWYVLSVASILIIWLLCRRSPIVAFPLSPLLLWGWLLVAENIVIYLFTPNAVFLISGESFFRQMLPAAALIILACAIILRPIPSPNPNPS